MVFEDADLIATFDINPMVEREKEVESYTFNTFISDFGGLLGLFLGLSFWDIYKILVAWHEEVTKKGRKRGISWPGRVTPQ